MKPLPEVPLVSIVTPSYNTGAFIEETLRSVESQGYPLVEHIVLDSGSTDETPQILSRFPSIRLISPAPSGYSEKVNYGFGIARGDIVAWLNADDYYLPGAIAKAVEAFKRNPDVALVYCNFLHVDEHSVEIDRERSKQATFRQLLEERNYVPLQGAFFRRDALEQVGAMVDTRYQLVQDWELWLRLANAFPILHVDDWWGAFRVRHGQRSDLHKYAFWIQGRRMTREHGAHFFAPIFWSFWGGKAVRAARMLRRGQFDVFAAKARDFLVRFLLRRESKA